MKQQSKRIAIVGHACKLAGANGPSEFWDNIIRQGSHITNGPANRKYLDSHWEDSVKGNGESIQYGGFVDDVAAFDHNFFSIPRPVANLMDPQQRIMLELTQSCFEDAAIPPSSVAAKDTGVYFAAFNHDYKELLDSSCNPIEAHYATGTAPASIPGRVSNYFDLRGPSVLVDAACSGSLHALHLAVQGMEYGDCEMALVGAVNYILTPSRQISFDKMGMLSPTGVSYTFDSRANGYVRSEGAIVLCIKYLDRAIADGDHIHSVIAGTAINHTGKARTLTRPAPKAQAAVIVRAHERAQFPVESIGNFQAHGTATPVGDPMEMAGILESFETLAARQNKKTGVGYCTLESAKVHFGHAEAAAGFVGVMAVTMSMKNQVLPALMNFEKINPSIDLADTPFCIPDQNTPWKPTKDSNGNSFPLRAGVSSHGFTGANAHVALEQAPGPVKPSEASLKNEKISHSAYLIAISAKTEKSLTRQRAELSAWLAKAKNGNTLLDMSATTLLGRDHYKCREAYLCDSLDTLEDQLREISSFGESEGYFSNRSGTKKSIEAGTSEGNKLEQEATRAIEQLVTEAGINPGEYRAKLRVLAEAYTLGHDPDWHTLFEGRPYKRISMPGTAFEKVRCWFKAISKAAISKSDTSSVYLHPLLHANTSTFKEQRFTSSFVGHEPFLSEGCGDLAGQKVLPELVVLEMIREAIVRSDPDYDGGSKDSVIRLNNVYWENTVVGGSQAATIHTSIFPGERKQAEQAAYTFEIYSEAGTEDYPVYCGGEVIIESKSACRPNYIDINTLREIIPRQSSTVHPFDELFADGNQFLSKLKVLTEEGPKTNFGIPLGALQATQTLIDSLVSPGTQPESMTSIIVFNPCPSNLWILVRRKFPALNSAIRRTLDIDFCDEQGRVCVQFKGLSVKQTRDGLKSSLQRSAGELSLNNSILLAPCWKEEKATEESRIHADRTPKTDPDRHIVVALEPRPDIEEAIKERMLTMRKEVTSFHLPYCQDKDINKRYISYAGILLEMIQAIFNDLREQSGTTLLQLLIQENDQERGQAELFSGLLGMLRTAHHEDPQFLGQLICIDSSENAQTLINKLNENRRSPNDQCVKYSRGQRYVRRWKPVDQLGMKYKPDNQHLPWKDQGVYLITGGSGALGLIFAEEIARRVKSPTVVLTGRREIAPNSLQIEALRNLGAVVDYQQVDVSDECQIKSLVQYVNEKHGPIQGIIHSAGLIRDSFIANKTLDELHQVMSPKVSGLINLDTATRDQPLDFIACFASTSGALGNVGQADYAAANAFYDTYASYRNGLVRKGLRHGHTISLDWPLWKDGGMEVDDATQEILREDLGVVPMATETGIQAFYDAWASGESQVMVLEGDMPRIKGGLLEQERTSEPEQATRDEPLNRDALHQKLQASIISIVSETLETDAGDIEATMSLNAELGVDSALMTSIASKLRKAYGVKVTAAKLFRYPTIAKLTDHLLDKHEGEVIKHFKVIEERPSEGNAENSSATAQIRAEQATPHPRHRQRFLERIHQQSIGDGARAIVGEPSAVQIPLAVIGRSCRAAHSEGPDELWENIRSGKDCTHPVPSSRWKLSANGRPEALQGGFIKDADKFDAKFFGILPREARGMDPQQRLALEYTWKAIEDAGYSAKSLSGSDTAVFIGTSSTDYASPMGTGKIDGYTVTNRSPAIVAGRISKTLNLRGPCNSIDTGCSASLAALARAADVIRSGRSRMALVGGVHINTVPEAYDIRDAAKMLSPDRRCKTFSAQANGFGPGEGVGIVVVKKLSDAIEDGDHIYAVVRSVYENHGGDAGSLTAPNPEAQADLLQSAYIQAGLDPTRLDYLEAHGTGTEIGDPIEVDAAIEAFERFNKQRENGPEPKCALGSIKANIGHTESAAGVLSLIKLTLQIEHRTLAPTIYCERVNPQIQLDRTPFYIPRYSQHWKAQVGPDGRELTRLAGVSSFGFGGSNVHVVVEEHIRDAESSNPKNGNEGSSYAVLLSAKTPDRLMARARNLFVDITKKPYTDDDLNSIAYVLQVGRDAMPVRLGIVVSSIDVLRNKLMDFVDGNCNVEDLYSSLSDEAADLGSPTTDIDTARRVDECLRTGDIAEIVRLWVKGTEFDWHRLYGEERPLRIPLPTYSFVGKSYWHEGTANQSTTTRAVGPRSLNNT